MFGRIALDFLFHLGFSLAPRVVEVSAGMRKASAMGCTYRYRMMVVRWLNLKSDLLEEDDIADLCGVALRGWSSDPFVILL